MRKGAGEEERVRWGKKGLQESMSGHDRFRTDHFRLGPDTWRLKLHMLSQRFFRSSYMCKHWFVSVDAFMNECPVVLRDDRGKPEDIHPPYTP